MKIAVRRISLGLSTAVAATSLALVLAPAPAMAITPIKYYPYTVQGGQQCLADAKAGGPDYFCASRVYNGTGNYILMRA